MQNIDVLIAGGTLVDPTHQRHGRFDVALAGGRVAAVEPELDRAHAARVVDASGKLVLPGLIDTHVHLAGSPAAARMLVRAGVTTALDMAARAQGLLPQLARDGAGLSVAFLFPLIPGDTLSGRDPRDDELSETIDRALADGALGVKVLGGHYPLTPEATARVVRIAASKRCWCAVHAGTTATGSNIDGLEELLTLADGLPVHVAHVNSYCRGQRTGDPLLEASRAIRALIAAPGARSESYLARINGTSAAMVDGAPKSEATKTCLTTGGFAPTESGMGEAIAAGWARVNGVQGDEVVLLDPPEGLRQWREQRAPMRVSFPVNDPGAAIGLALAKRDGRFVVTALSTDGGGIPRNVTLAKGLALVRFEALTLEEWVDKACASPARMLGLPDKGHLGVGADGDAIVVDPVGARAEAVAAAGRLVLEQGAVTGQGARLVTTAQGRPAAQSQGLDSYESRPEWLCSGC